MFLNKCKTTKEHKMKAVPVIAGAVYRVTGNGFDMEVIAPGPVDALLFVVDMIKHLERMA